ITLSPSQRHTLLRYYRGAFNHRTRLRAHLLLLLHDGRSWEHIAQTLYCSTRTIGRWKQRFQRQGLAALAGLPTGAPRRLSTGWIALVVTGVLQGTPRVFGLVRSRWCCQTLAWLLWQEHRVAVSRETIRRWLHPGALVGPRP